LGITLQYAASDLRLKDYIDDCEINAIDLIKQIKMHQFDWKEDGTHQNIGFIADELEELDNRFVINGGSTGGENPVEDVKCVNMFYLEGYIVKAIQEQQAIIDEQQKEINDLKNILDLVIAKLGVE
jgi:hypothetical protein